MNRAIRILLVEDTYIAQIIVKTQLTSQGCHVDVAADGSVALSKALSTPYDLILMDIGLGEGPDGFEVTQQIKQLSTVNKNTPIVAVTSHDGAEYIQKSIDVGMEYYFNKPFTAEDAKTIVDYIKKNLE